MSLVSPLFSIVLGPSWFFFGTAACVVGFLIATTLAARDLWPFSHYPMFAEPMEATRLGYFTLRFRMEDGRMVGFTGVARALEEDFHQACQARWPDAAPGRPALDEVGRRFWREAAQLSPGLARATAAEVVLRVAQLGRAGGVSVAEKTVHTITLGVAEAA